MSCTFSALGKLGRMGNQLWQIAATIGYARQYNQDYVLPTWEYAQHFKESIKQSQTINGFSAVREKTFHYTKLPRTNNADLYGYFQSRRYWQHCEPEIRRTFEPNDAIQAILDKTPIEGESCAIHIRRGDYVNLSDYHQVLPIEYYRDAIAKMGVDNYTIFCEDEEYVKLFIANLGLEGRAHFQKSGNDLLDWFIMRQHKHHIIANSSYSWWSSYLAKEDGKRVIAPRKELWFGPKYKQNNVDDLYLQNWELV